MLTFSVATNWDDALIKGIESLDSAHKVTEVFGKLAMDFVGGARAAYALASVSKTRAVQHIKYVKSTGRKFNYLLNASCLDNREFTRSGQRQIRRLLSWLDSLGIDVITVANPYLGHLIKKEYPRFELAVSSLASTASVRQARFWTDDIGADKITLSAHKTNRNFPLLKKIRSQTDCELQLLANQLCLHDCPLGIYHITFLSHASQSDHLLKGFGIDWSLINCRYKLFTQPEEFIKSTWIRPEDVGYYESVGIDSLKIIDRIRDTPSIISILKAYLEKRFEGNLADFILHANAPSNKESFFRGLRFFFHPLHINIFKLNKFRGLFSDIGIYVDNRKMDGFLQYFFEGKCKIDDCQDCNYCRKFTENAVCVNNTTKEKLEKKLEEINRGLVKGEFFKFF